MKVIYLDNTTSTSDYLLGLKTDEDVVAVAEYQSAGRGAGSNTWESEAGKNLLFSMLIHPTWLEPRNQFLMSMVHAIALCEVLSEETRELGNKEARDLGSNGFTIKWPNDIYWYDKKISGTIVDCTLKGGKISDMVIGTGINVNQREFKSDAPNPVSLSQITGMKYDCREILEKVVDMQQRAVSLLRQKVVDVDSVVRKYHQRLYRREGFFPYEDKEGRFEAELVQVLPNGIMQLRRRDGTERSYEFKQVKFII